MLAETSAAMQQTQPIIGTTKSVSMSIFFLDSHLDKLLIHPYKMNACQYTPVGRNRPTQNCRMM